MACHQRHVDFCLLAGDVIMLAMRQKDAVVLVLDFIAAGDDVSQSTTFRLPAECGRHARHYCGLWETGRRRLTSLTQQMGTAALPGTGRIYDGENEVLEG